MSPEGCIYSDPWHDPQVSLGPFGLPRTRGRAQETSRRRGEWRHLAKRAIVDKPTPLRTTPRCDSPPPSGDERWGPVWPDNVQETGVSPGGQPGSPIMAADAQQVRQLEERPGHGPDPRFLCPTGGGAPVPGWLVSIAGCGRGDSSEAQGTSRVSGQVAEAPRGVVLPPTDSPSRKRWISATHTRARMRTRRFRD
jgi:hypothetical protein